MHPLKFRVRFLATIMALVFAPGIANSEVISTYNGFEDTSGLTLNGSTGVVNTSDGAVLRLTQAAQGQVGSAFSTETVSTDQFTSVFSFRITDPGGPVFGGNINNGADGIVFAVQNVANTVGTPGEGIGIQGVSPSIAIAYDTWLNSDNNDPSQNYIGIDVNGNIFHGPSNGPTVVLPSPELGAGDRWWSWVTYDSHTLSVYLLQSESTTQPLRPDLPVLSYPVDLASLLGGTTAYAGFTSSTGLDFENHDILYWQYTPSVPEPSTFVLISVGGLAALWCGRKSRKG